MVSTLLLCRKCGMEKTIAEFGVNVKPRFKDICLDCRTKQQRMTSFGIDHDAEWIKQNGLCKICGRPLLSIRRAQADHDHVTGKFRGLLCKRCNLTVGWIEGSFGLLEKMVSYIRGDVE